jgi:hypothetical protein
MLVFLSHRRLKAGSTFEDYRKAWQPESIPEGIEERIYHARSLEDPNEIVSFGIMDIAPDQIADTMAKFGDEAAEERRQARMAEHVEWTGVDRIFEVVEELAVK